MWLSFVAISALVIASTGCSGPLANLLATATPTLTPTVASPTPSSTPTVPTATPTSTLTPTATSTPTVTATPTATAEPLVAIVSLSSASVAQGRTFAIRVSVNQPARVSGRIEERAIHFVSPSEGEHVALVGVRALAPLSVQPISVTVASSHNQRMTLQTEIAVISGGYGQETIPLSPQLSALLDPAITQPELLRLAEVYGVFSPKLSWSGSMDWPLSGPITSKFGTRRSYGGALSSYHSGTDIDGETGDPVSAPAGGRVVLADALKVRGNAVIIDHGAGVLTGYYHLERIDVALDQQVERGDIVGLVGSTGLSTGSHLHWEMRVGGVAVDAVEWTQRVFP